MHTIDTKLMNLEKGKVSFGIHCKRSESKCDHFISDASAPSVLTGLKQLSVTSAAQQKQQELLKQVAEQQFVPKDPPAEFEFIADPPSISALDLYVKTISKVISAKDVHPAKFVTMCKTYMDMGCSSIRHKT